MVFLNLTIFCRHPAAVAALVCDSLNDKYQSLHSSRERKRMMLPMSVHGCAVANF